MVNGQWSMVNKACNLNNFFFNHFWKTTNSFSVLWNVFDAGILVSLAGAWF
jgi:hypothetical protein